MTKKIQPGKPDERRTRRQLYARRQDHPSNRRRGRPSVMHLFEEELRRRASEGRLEPTLGKQVRELLKWFQRSYREHPYTPKINTLRRKLGSVFKLLR